MQIELEECSALGRLRTRKARDTQQSLGYYLSTIVGTLYCIFFGRWAGTAQSVLRLVTGCNVRG